MSIEKKSLISNRMASQKAIVAKSKGTKVASTKTISSHVAAKPKLAGLTRTHVAVKTRLAGLTRVSTY